jgi:hypothetical protein
MNKCKSTDCEFVKKYESYDKLSSVSISLGNLSKPKESSFMHYTSSPEKKVKAKVKKIPFIFDSQNENSIDKMECCSCDYKDFISNKMKCGHLICLDCLDHVRQDTCPVCDEIMEGPLLTEEILTEINYKIKEDE